MKRLIILGMWIASAADPDETIEFMDTLGLLSVRP